MTSDLESLKKHPSVLRMYLDRLHFKREGSEYVAACPEHKDNTPSLHIFQKNGQPYLFKCFGACGKTGSIIDFVQLVDGCDLKTAIRTVEEYCGGSWEGTREKVDRVFKPAVPETNKEYVKYTLAQYKTFEDALGRSRDGVEWLRSRGISLATAQALHWGFREDVSKFCRDEWAGGGWMVFPSIEGEEVVSIKYRSIVKKAFVRQPGCRTVLTGLNEIDVLEPLFLVEGEVDQATLKQAGFRAVSLPSAGYAPTPEEMDRLVQGEHLMLAGDSDEAGSKAMDKLWSAVQERCFRLHWGEGKKDANEVFLSTCGGDVAKFRELVLGLVEKAKSNPLPNVYALNDVLMSSERTNLADHPDRLRLPWSGPDKFAVLLPGSLAVFFSTNTKQAKTTLIMNATIYAARKHGERVLSYSAELQPAELGAMVVAHVTKRDRNFLTHKDNLDAAKLLKDVNFWIGRDPTLTSIGPVLDLIEAAVRRLGITVVVLDTLSFFTNGPQAVMEQRDAMQRLKLLATRYGLKVIVVSQPRKAAPSEVGKRPHLTALLGSEAIGSTADAIYCLHRNYIREPTTDTQDEYESAAELHLLAARSRGPGGVMANLFFLGKVATFIEDSQVAREPQENSGLFHN